MNKTPQDSEDILRRVKDQVQESLLPPKPEGPPDLDDQQIILSENVIYTVGALSSIDGLPQPTRDESVEEARKILRWLRNMEFVDRDVEQWLDNSTPKVVVAKKQALQKLIQIIAVHIHHAKLRNAELQDDTRLENAADAIRAMALTIAEHTFNLLRDNHPKLVELEALIDAMPETALMRQSQSLAHLLDVIELGMERATGQEVSDLSAAFRLQELGKELKQTAFQLQSVETLEAPTREESIDLARDILKKMQHMSFGGMTVKELIETGNLEEKVAFAKQFAEMADMYRNLLSETAALNPNILQDHRVQQANDAVEQFAHSVHLMAAKEIPSSVAAAQQISAEVTRAPEEWGKLNDRTVDRLIKSAEGGLEKAIEEAAEQQEHQQDDEQAQEMAENALQQADQKRRKKKRRGDTKSRSGKGGKKQRKQNMDMSADDYVLKEGRFTVDAQNARVVSSIAAPIVPSAPTVAMPGVKMEDMDAIRKLGGSLRDIGKQLKDLTGTVSTVSANDKILPSPNEQSAAQRIIDTELQKPHNPRGTNGPGV